MKLSDWFDLRTGYRRLVHEALMEPIPGGPRWRYVWGSTLVFILVVQVITGILLMTAYSPSATTAWSSVWYIQTQMGLGWFIRGLHHFGSQAMVILLPLHILQVVIAKAYRAPREVNWWIGVLMLLCVLGLSLTGYLLPWDQKGYWATKVATNIMSLTPLIGKGLQKLVVGGSEYGHLTLSRFYTLHVMVLPGALILLLVAHVALFRRHGITYNPRDANLPHGTFWPEQVLKDSIACLVVLCTIAGAAVYVHEVRHEQLLDAPADPSASNYPARPEWYFLFLFQMLKYFEGAKMEVLGAIGIPTAVLFTLFIIPLLDKVLWRWLAHAFTLLFVIGVIGGAGWLTVQAVKADTDPPDAVIAPIHERQQSTQPAELTPTEQNLLRARQFNDQRREATRVAGRVLELASRSGIPPAGPLELVISDPIIRGPQLFAAHCAACHRYDGHNGLGMRMLPRATASDLAGFASRTWIRRLLQNPMSHDHFGLMFKPDSEDGKRAHAHTRMAEWVQEQLEENTDAADRQALLANFDAVAAYLADEAQHPGRLERVLFTQAAATSQRASAAAASIDTLGADEAVIRKGRAYFMNACNECHSYGGERSGTTRGPEMRGYGSVQWIEKMIENPADDALYRSTGKEPAQMPAFKDRLTPQERRLIAEWLHG